MQQDYETDAIARIFRRLSGGRDGREFELASKTLRTYRRYDSGEKACQDIADELGLTLYPVDPVTGKPAQVDPEVLKEIFDGIIRRGGAVGSVTIARQALSLTYRLRGHPPVDWSRLREYLQGMRRKRGGPRRRARPLRAVDLEAILGRLDPANPRGARDGFLLALGWAAALRSDELVTLGWDAPGPKGKGFVTTSSRGVEIHLDIAKTAQDGSGQTVIVPADDARLVMTWMTFWEKAAGRQPGRLVFLQMSRGDRVIPRGMAAVAVTQVVRTHVLKYLIGSGMEEVAAVTAANAYRSHSLRAGYATEAAAGGVVEARIRDHCRHRSALTTAGYIRLAQDWDNSGLKGLLR
jgi:integrase